MCCLVKPGFSREEKSLNHVALVAIFWISTNRVTADMRENCEKVDIYDFPVQDYTQEQNGNPYLFFHCSTMQMAVSVKKDCCDPDILLPW